ncbi:MAG: carboxypeptidase M32 [Aminipila sp.]
MKRYNGQYSKKLVEFKEKIKRIEYLKYTVNSLIYWDKITNMPVDSIGYRSQVMGFLAEELYKSLSDVKLQKYLDFFHGNEENDDVVNGMIVRLKRNNSYVGKIPQKKYGEYISLVANAEQVWEKAKKESDFQLFNPYLEQIVEYFKEFAEYWGYEKHPYDACVGYYEEGVTVENLDKMVKELRNFIVENLKIIQEKQAKCNERPLSHSYRVPMAVEEQEKLSKWILETIGFSFSSGRLDAGAHPTTLANSPKDVRIVTSYDESDIRTGIFNTLHEGGKGLYEQDIDENLMGTLLAEVASFGIEEAVGRFYENIIGRNKEFIKQLCDKIYELCPNTKIDYQAFYNSVNYVEPSFIRINADEVTYMLHIIIRYELEKELITGKIAVNDLPKEWKRKYKEYLGIEPKNHSDGVLQDIHWAAGYFGFFPSYILANLLSAQLAGNIENELKPIDELIASGDFEQIHQWLKHHLHKFGATYTSSEMIGKIAENGLSAEDYIKYIKCKYID